MEEEARDGAVGLPARLGRLPPLQPEADRGAAGGARRTWRSARWSPEALARRVAAIEATGLGVGWIDGDVGHGPAYRFSDPDGHVFELYYEAERYVAARAPAAVAGGTSRSATSAAAPPSSGSTTSTCSPPTSARAASSRRSELGYRLYERIELDDGTRDRRLAEPVDRRARADLRRRRTTARAGGCTTSPSGSTRARSACAPPTSSSTTTSRSRPRRRSTASRRASSSTASSRAATGSR